MRIDRFTLLIGIVVVVIVIFFVVSFVLTEVRNGEVECVDVSAAAGFVYDVCYDSYTQNVFMLVRGESDYYLDVFRVSLFDGRNRSYDLGYNVDNVSQLYKFYASRNPLMVSLDLNAFNGDPFCESAKELRVRYCETRRPGDGRGSLNGSEVEDYVPLPPPTREDYPEGANYSEKEIVWLNVCRSDWSCLDWEECDGTLQRRSCEDLNGCVIPVGSPETVRYCGEECFEDWSCDWGDCVGGFMEPACYDLNNCGTEYDKPSPMSCVSGVVCRPDITCGNWGDCEVDYGLLDLVGEEIGGITGSRSRVCIDKSGCVESRKEVESCSIGVDIYVRKFRKCGEDFVGIYNRLTNKLIARVKEGDGGEPFMDIYFDDRDESVYCDYCYDGILNANEEGIDCGGSCMSCEEKYRIRAFRRKSFFGRVVDWLRGLF
jgi:hypothetical protein